MSKQETSLVKHEYIDRTTGEPVIEFLTPPFFRGVDLETRDSHKHELFTMLLTGCRHLKPQKDAFFQAWEQNYLNNLHTFKNGQFSLSIRFEIDQNGARTGRYSIAPDYLIDLTEEELAFDHLERQQQNRISFTLRPKPGSTKPLLM